MALFRKNLLIAFCPSCGSYGVPKDEKVYDPTTQKSFFVCRDCHTVHQDLNLSMLRVVDGAEWSKKHPVKDHILHTPKIGGKQ